MPIANAWTNIILHGPAHSRGFVRLTGSHPQDLLDINKLRFQSPEAKGDVVLYREALKRARKLMARNPAAQHILREVSPGDDVKDDKGLEEYVYKQVFGA